MRLRERDVAANEVYLKNDNVSDDILCAYESYGVPTVTGHNSAGTRMRKGFLVLVLPRLSCRSFRSRLFVPSMDELSSTKSLLLSD